MRKEDSTRESSQSRGLSFATFTIATRIGEIEDRIRNDYLGFGDPEEVAHERGRARGLREALEILKTCGV